MPVTRSRPAGGNAPGVRELARSLWRERWLVLESQISGDPWLLGYGFCMTDVYIAAMSRWGQQEAWRPEHIPRVEKLAAAVAARPIIGDVWRRHFTRG